MSIEVENAINQIMEGISNAEILGFLPTQTSFTPDAIRNAYRALCLKVHPDKCPPELRARATDAFKKLYEAKAELLNGNSNRNPEYTPGEDFDDLLDDLDFIILENPLSPLRKDIFNKVVTACSTNLSLFTSYLPRLERTAFYEAAFQNYKLFGYNLIKYKANPSALSVLNRSAFLTMVYKKNRDMLSFISHYSPELFKNCILNELPNLESCDEFEGYYLLTKDDLSNEEYLTAATQYPLLTLALKKLDVIKKTNEEELHFIQENLKKTPRLFLGLYENHRLNLMLSLTALMHTTDEKDLLAIINAMPLEEMSSHLVKALIRSFPGLEKAVFKADRSSLAGQILSRDANLMGNTGAMLFIFALILIPLPYVALGVVGFTIALLLGYWAYQNLRANLHTPEINKVKKSIGFFDSSEKQPATVEEDFVPAETFGVSA